MGNRDDNLVAHSDGFIGHLSLKTNNSSLAIQVEMLDLCGADGPIDEGEGGVGTYMATKMTINYRQYYQ